VTRRSWYAIAAAAVVTTVGVVAVVSFVSSLEAGRRQLVQLEQGLQLNDSLDGVRTAAGAPEYAMLYIKPSKRGLVAISSPAFPPSNWTLWLDFDERGLCSVRYRIIDDARIRAPDAPPDRERPCGNETSSPAR
jgi:hypothetical protein